jgi:glyoxylase-like metal-dependent hydrolase (beta-lactamase superfamily II)
LTSSVRAVPLPLRHVGSVNAWLLRGEPLTLLDTGPMNDEALQALEEGLRRAGVRLEDIELVLATHHHLDHVGLAATVKRRSGAPVAVLGEVADYTRDYLRNIEQDRAFSHRLMTAHGVPREVIDGNEEFWDFLRSNSADLEADVRLEDGQRIRAGGRDLDVVARPGHSRTDTLFVDASARLAFVGDHLLAGISSNTEISPVGVTDGARPRPRTEYLKSLKQTATMALNTLLTGHGKPVRAHRALVELRIAEHRRRAARIAGILLREPQSAYGVAEQLWPERTVRKQPLLVVWEVLGHLELLLGAGLATEVLAEDSGPRFALADSRPCASSRARHPRQPTSVRRTGHGIR